MNFALFENTKNPEQNHRLYTDLIDSIVVYKAEHIDHALEQMQHASQQGYYLSGYFSYELGQYLIDKQIDRLQPNTKPLLEWHVFEQKQSLNKAEVDRFLSQFDSSFAIDDLSLSQNKFDYIANLKQIKQHIGAGDCYQVNYTLKYHFALDGSPLALYKALRVTQPVEYSAMLNFDQHQILSISPELFVKKTGLQLQSKPMKGTHQRSQIAAVDSKIPEIMRQDSKTIAENVMIVDLIRNDFHRVCEANSVSVSQLFDIEQFPTLYQMTSTINGQIKANLSLKQLLHGIFPCGSITGAPKLMSMQLISQLEQSERGVYTGALGYIDPNQDFCFNVAIRTIDIYDTKAEMGIGSGIVTASDPNLEYEECLLKAKFLTQLQLD